MTIFKEFSEELIGMFFAEKRLTVAILALVAAAGWLVGPIGLDQLLVGAVLLFGCLGLLIESVCRAARAAAVVSPTPASWSDE